METPLGLRLVIHRIKPDNSLQEDMQFWMRIRILCNLEEGLENVYISFVNEVGEYDEDGS